MVLQCSVRLCNIVQLRPMLYNPCSFKAPYKLCPMLYNPCSRGGMHSVRACVRSCVCVWIGAWHRYVQCVYYRPAPLPSLHQLVPLSYAFLLAGPSGIAPVLLIAASVLLLCHPSIRVWSQMVNLVTNPPHLALLCPPVRFTPSPHPVLSPLPDPCLSHRHMGGDFPNARKVQGLSPAILHVIVRRL